MTRYDLIRRRIAPIAFVLGLGLLVHHTCTKQQRIHATIVIDAGEAAARVDAIHADLVVDGESWGVVTRTRIGDRIGAARFEVSVPKPDAELRIDVDLGAQRKHIVRRIRLDEGVTLTVPLAADLRP